MRKIRRLHAGGNTVLDAFQEELFWLNATVFYLRVSL